jgi:hypothetical protein
MTVICMIALSVPFILFIPVIPMNETTHSLWLQHGLCFSLSITNPQHTEFYGSASYYFSRTGEVYIPSGGHWWWLPGPVYTGSCPLYP